MPRSAAIVALATLTFLHALFLPTLPARADAYRRAVTYFNEACGDCNAYLRETLAPTLAELGVAEQAQRDYLNDRSYRRELNDLLDTFDVPLELRSHLVTIINDGELILAGHVPERIIRDLFALDPNAIPDRLVVYQDAMPGHGGGATAYQVWSPGLPARTYAIDEPIATHLAWSASAERTSGAGERSRVLWPIVLATGLLDGINPCAIAVLIFFIAFLLTLRSSLRRILLYGAVFIAVIFLVYLGIGLGLLRAITFSNQPHLMAKVGAWLVIALGLVNLKDFWWPRFPFHLGVPRVAGGMLQRWLTKATLPAVFVGAFLVGLCTFPCSGGIYVAIVGLLASRQTFLSGLGYLVLYNVMFVLPLVAILVASSNRFVLGRIAVAQRETSRAVKLWLGLGMVTLGAVILAFFI